MNQLYARVFTQILDSSLAENWQTRHVFEDVLKLADNGVVDMTRQAIARRTNVPLEIVNAALAELEAPDLASRDATEQGRRLVRLDDHRDWGWTIVNWDKYERVKSIADHREQARERQRRKRERAEPLPPAPPTPEAEAEAEAEGALHSVTERDCHGASVTERDRSVTAKAAPAAPTSQTDEEWTATLKANSAYIGIDVQREHSKMLEWCRANGKVPTRRRFVNWLNRCDKPLATNTATNHAGGF